MNTTSTGTRWKDNLRKGLLARIFCVLPSIRAINATTNAKETVLTRRRILSEDEASEQNHGYFHSRLITLSHPPRSCSSRLTCHMRRATCSPTLSEFFANFQEIDLFVVNPIQFLFHLALLSFTSTRRKSALYSCLVLCCPESPDDSYV